MSSFAPEGFLGSAPATAPLAATQGAGSAGLNAKIAQYLSDPVSNIPTEFKKWIEDYLALNIPLIPISQIVGFTGFTGQIATFNASDQSTASSTATDLATPGPTITGLPDGKYLIFFGCEAWNASAGFGSAMYVTTNGTTGDRAITMGNTDAETVARVTAVTLSNGGNNTVSAKYSRINGAGTANFRFRWVVVLKYSNA